MDSTRDKILEAVLAVLPLAVIYFAGWAYLSSYLRAFGLDATQVSIPLTTVVVYAFTPLTTWPVLASVGTCVAIWVFVSIFETKAVADAFRRFAFPIVITALVGLLFLVNIVSNSLAIDLADSVWRGRHLQTEVVPVQSTTNSLDPAYVSYQRCRSGIRLQQILGLPDQTFLLCRGDLNPCERGTIFLVNSTGSIVLRANISRENLGGSNGCETRIR